MGLFPVVDVTGWPAVKPEPEGRSGKEWLRESGVPLDSDSREQDWLFKPVVVHDNGQRQGGDWAEKIVAELGRLVGVPCAKVELAVRSGERGTVSRNVAPDRWSLIPGYVLLSALVPGYVGGARLPGRPGHSPENVVRVLSDCDPPPGMSGLDAVGAFAGYLVLDAWVANQDRHDRNWAVLECSDQPAPRRLAASYDHTSSLGFNLLEERRIGLLRTTGGVDRWAERGRALQFEHDPQAKPLASTLVQLACQVLRMAGPEVEQFWLGRLESAGPKLVGPLIERVPGLSDPTMAFILELLESNRRRLIGDR